MKKSTSSNAIEIETAREQMGGCDDSVLVQLAGALYSESEIRIEEMQDAIEQENPGAIGRSAHALKGAAELFGANDLLQRLQRIESEAKEQNMSALVAQFDELKTSAREVRVELQRFLDEKGG